MNRYPDIPNSKFLLTPTPVEENEDPKSDDTSEPTARRKLELARWSRAMRLLEQEEMQHAHKMGTPKQEQKREENPGLTMESGVPRLAPLLAQKSHPMTKEKQQDLQLWRQQQPQKNQGQQSEVGGIPHAR